MKMHHCLFGITVVAITSDNESHQRVSLLVVATVPVALIDASSGIFYISESNI